ncbi:MAG: hypothetical protein SOV24_00035 [Muribaculaceae bacterium]|nr:hypothetical protein [Muribaculaceae bacterium]MCI6495003.1 hypothetical protein [Bacteroidales bacterium]MDD6702700.1 hypothetical protein [Bacteroidales bacterium]MDD6942657.1 hypothetical protein [Bacteroidales bacterium]MDY2732748.1 hypothetical protein [Muribaculaceae bacterium]
MVYRFKLVSDEVSNFSREIEIDSQNTFLQLRNVILESVDYTKDELDSFFLCNDDWEREEEITLEDMGNLAIDQDCWLMESTPIGELVEDEGQKLSFVFDYLTERSFFLELKEIFPSRHLMEPICTIKRGKAPAQKVDMDEFDRVVDSKAQAALEDIDIEPIDESNFNEEDLEDGFDILSTY